MILVLDNGGQYSDHAIRFIEIPSTVNLEDAIDVLCNTPQWGHPFALAVAEEFKWYHGTARPLLTYIEELAENLPWREDCADPDEKQKCREYAEKLKALLAQLR